MASTEIEVPSFDFSAYLYQQILEAQLVFKRQNLPELTDESAQEPLIQMMRSFALVGHLNNVLLDLVANEATLPTAQLQDTVRNMLKLINYDLAAAQPAQTDLIYKLAQVISATTVVIPQFAQAATISSVDEPARFFEALEALDVTPTDLLSAAFAVEDSVFTDVVSDLNDETGGFEVTPWATPVGGDATREGDSLMWGHAEAMWDEIDVEVDTAGSGIVGVFEYYDGVVDKTAPTSIVDNGTTITVDLTSYLGTTDLRGTRIRVKLNTTAAFEDLFSDFVAGVNVVTTTGILGQTTVSISKDDYTVGSRWERFSTITDDTLDLTVSEKVAFGLPQTLTENWQIGEFEGISAFWMRYRIITAVAPVSPILDRIHIDTGGQYLKRLVTQGQVVEDEVLGSSTGEPNQTFLTARTDFLFGFSKLEVDAVEWVLVGDFLSSRPTDRHYTIELDEDARGRFTFGDGATGQIPAPGINNIVITQYRHNANIDGNVGANTITGDRTGLTLVDRLFNPRPATGWEEAEGSTAASLERAKVAGPASLRTREVAISPNDVEFLATRASQIDSAVPSITRAFAIEEGFGPKTIECVVVSAGAAILSTEQLDLISEFFNGDQFSSPPKTKRLVANQEVTAVNYSPRTIDITAEVIATGSVTRIQIENALKNVLQPETLMSDGVTFEWNFGEDIPTDRIIHEIFKVDTTIRDVNLILINGLAPADVVLVPRELPVAGTITIVVNP